MGAQIGKDRSEGQYEIHQTICSIGCSCVVIVSLRKQIPDI